MKQLTLLALAALMSACASTPTSDPDGLLPTPKPSGLQVAGGQVLRLENFPSQQVHARNVDIWLPEGYSPSQRYAVLYMHDGQMLYDSTATWNQQEWRVDEWMSKLIAAGDIPPAIVVSPWNAGEYRHSDYFPEKALDYLPEGIRESHVENYLQGKPSADAYLRFLAQELKPYIDSAFSTYPDAAHTFVMGSSMGGLISMYAYCEYPEVFGGAGCLSTHWVGDAGRKTDEIPMAFAAYMDAHLRAPSRGKIYFDYGTATLDSLYEPHQLRIDSLMRAHGYDSTRWITRKFEGAPHDERAWASRLHLPLRFLMGQ
jgi:enterochelin esterase-like enzyme